MCGKNQIDRTNGLGGVRDHTYIYKDKHIKRNKNMDCCLTKPVPKYNPSILGLNFQ